MALAPAILAAPATVSEVGIIVAEVAAGDAQGGASLAVGASAVSKGGATYTPARAATSRPNGYVNRSRDTRPTTGVDMTRADSLVKNGDMRERRNRRDTGG